MAPKIAKEYHERPGGHARELQQRQNRAFGAVMSCATRKKGGDTKWPTLSHSYYPYLPGAMGLLAQHMSHQIDHRASTDVPNHNRCHVAMYTPYTSPIRYILGPITHPILALY